MHNKPGLLRTAAAASLSLLAIGSASAQDLGSDVYATLNGEPIKYEIFEFLFSSQNVDQEQARPVIQRYLSELASAQEALKQGLGESDEIRLSMEIHRTRVLALAYARKFLEANPVTDEQVEERYEQDKERAAASDEYKVSHILVEDEQLANDLLDQIAGDPATFAELAKEHSIDPGSGANGGELGWAIPQVFVPEFGSAMAALAPGSFTAAPIQTQFGWHLIYVEDTRPVELPPLDDENRQRILESMQNERFTAEIARLLDEADIQYNENPDLN